MLSIGERRLLRHSTFPTTLLLFGICADDGLDSRSQNDLEIQYAYIQKTILVATVSSSLRLFFHKKAVRIWELPVSFQRGAKLTGGSQQGPNTPT